MADREDELEPVEVDQKLSEIRNLPYTKILRATIFFGTPLMSFQKTSSNTSSSPSKRTKQIAASALF